MSTARRATVSIALVVGLALSLPTAVPAAQRSLKPVTRKHGVVTFRLSRISPARITRAVIRIDRHRDRIRVARARAAARQGRLRVRLPRWARRRPFVRVRLVLNLRNAVPAPNEQIGGGTPGAPGSGRPGSGPPGSGSPPDRPAPAGGASLTFPIRAAFYYPWYPETWHVNGPQIHFSPTLGRYASEDPTLQASHIRSLDYAGMDAAISEWTPPPHYRNTRLGQLLARTEAVGSPLRWSIYYTPEDKGNPSVSELAGHLAYVRDQLASSPAYLRVASRFVVFVWTNAPDDATCALADRWRSANTQIGNAAYVVLKVFRGYRNCASQPDNWHQYAPSSPTSAVPGHSLAVSPGLWHHDESAPRLDRDPARFQGSVRQMISSGDPGSS